MTDRLDADRLDLILASVGEHLIVEPAIGQRRPPQRARTRRILAAAAVVLVAAMIGALAVRPVREAVADWLGIGSTAVERVDEPEGAVTGLPRLATDLGAVSPDEAEAELGRPLPDTSATRLGRPDRLGLPVEGGVLLTWQEGETTLWVHGGSFRPQDLYRKLLGMGDLVRPVDDLGDDALLITGDHILQTPHRRLAAATVLLWTAGGLEYRLESDLDHAAMVDIARAID